MSFASSPDVVTFGEAMLRLTPPGHRRFEQASALELWVAGAELNVAVALARLGRSAAWVSRLPANALGRRVAGHARASGVDTDGVVWCSDGRLGLMFVEVGSAPRPSATLYDRAGSAFADLDPDEFDWGARLAGAGAFHTSGITPALSDACARATTEALAAARAAGCHTSFDLNFRARLSTADDARGLLESLAPTIDTLIASSGEVEAVFGLGGEPGELAAQLRELLGIERVVVSTRLAAGDHAQRRWSASVDGDASHEADSPAFGTVDPLGGGDAFSAGFLSGLLDGGPARGLEVGGAIAALKQSIPGDFAILEREEVEDLLNGADARTRR
jgi:2-dehydro-3-deoxygluconokinase